MQLVHGDFKKGIVRFRINDPDDLWYLSQIIEAGDLITGITTRKVKIGDSENAKVAKKTFKVTIEAETVDFSSTGHALRINGTIKEGPEDIPHGSYQSISLELDSEGMITKEQWLTHHKQKLEEAGKIKYAYLLCIFDREEALFALTKKFGYEILGRIQGEVPKKAKLQEIKKDFYEEIIKTLEIYNERHNPERIILASPAFYKEDVHRKIVVKELKAKIVLATCSDVSESALDEVIKRPELKDVLKQSRVREEQLLVEQVLQEINKENLAVYGWEEVQKAAFAGAVSDLIVTDQTIKHYREQKIYLKLDELMKKVDALQGKIHLITSEQDSGKRIDGLGGIAALLRYKMR
ncbi:mRNA surveillance protein pelota [Candidatus Woesearchaeota archaeon]|nr:mRNA surveillance protein pelota [Candidatus Woesearchaeota archaeon]